MKDKIKLPWSTEKEFYDMHAEIVFKKDTFYHVNMIGKNEEEDAHYLIQRLNLKKGDKVVDLGCGGGYLVSKISEICECIGISNSPECIKQAKINYPNCHFELANMEDFKVDNVTHYVTLESIGYADINKTMSTVYANLVDNGIFFVKDTTLISNPNEEEKVNIEYWEHYWKYYTMDVPTLISTAYQHKFRLLNYRELTFDSRLNMRPFMESLKNNIVVQDYPFPDVPVQIPTEFIFLKEKREKWVNPYV